MSEEVAPPVTAPAAPNGVVLRIMRRLKKSMMTPSSAHALSRALYLRALGAIYLIATLSWWVQAPGLVGSDGLLPMDAFLSAAKSSLQSQDRGLWTSVPTLFWLGAGDVMLHLVCGCGALFALLVVFGFFTGPSLLIAWFCYLSLVGTGGVFMSFQWDILLLEAGALGVLFSPWRAVRIQLRRPPPLFLPERWALFLQWMLAAKLMFQSGWVKLAWASPANPEWWPDGTAMTFHYFTQPLPNALAWWMHQAPPGFHVFSLWPMYIAELLCPLLVIFGNRARLVSAAGFSLLMLLVLLTGNYTYFNLLSMVLCIPLVADRWWEPASSRVRSWVRLRQKKKTSSTELPQPASRLSPCSPYAHLALRCWRAPAILILGLLTVCVVMRDFYRASQSVRDPALPWSHIQKDHTPTWGADLLRATQSFHLVNGYGLFRTMTTSRPEIVLEGSADGIEWQEYVLAWKPGPLDVRPRQIAPHQPRLAWQCWFAALEWRYNPQSWNAPWFSALVIKLLNNDYAALQYFDHNPFPNAPPRYLRAQLYLYEFTTPAQRRETGHWWTRSAAGMYLPIVSLPSS
jgi:lipase maturation factor 1